MDAVERASATERTGNGDGSPSLLDNLKAWHREGLRFRRTYQTEAEEDERYAHAKQWSPEEKQELRATNREPITLPHIQKVLAAMLGFRLQNKYEIKYMPRGASDLGLAEARTHLAKFAYDANHAEFKLSKATWQQYVVGLGWIFCGYQYDNPLKEPIKLDSVHWSEIGYDPHAQEDDLTDAKYLWREKWLNLEDAKRLYPEHAEALEQYAKMRSLGGSAEETNEFGFEVSHEHPGDQYGSIYTWQDSQFFHAGRREIRIVEMWYREKEWGAYLKMPNGDVQVFDRFNPRHHLAGMMGAKVQPGMVNRVYFATFCGDLILEKGPSPYEHGYFPYVPLWGYRDEKRRPYGIVRLLKDSQKVFNWGLSKLMWTASSRQAIVAPEEDTEEVREQLARPDGIMREKAPNGIRIVPNSDIVQFNQLIMQMGMEAMEQIGGAPAEMRGDESNAKSGRAILARQEAAVRQQMQFLDGEKRALVQIGEMLGSMFDQSYTDEKVLRITEANGQAATVAINVQDPLRRQELEAQGIRVFGDVNQDRYDVVVEATAMTATRRAAFAEELGGLLPNMPPELVVRLLPSYLRSLDSAAGEEMARAIEEANAQQAQQAQMMAQAQAMNEEQQLLKAQAQATNAQTKANEQALQIQMAQQAFAQQIGVPPDPGGVM